MDAVAAALNRPTSDWLAGILRCSQCGGSLSPSGEGVDCDSCGTGFPKNESGQLDLRLRSPRTYRVDFTLGDGGPDDSQTRIAPLVSRPSPEVDFAGIRIPKHMSRELLSYFPRARHGESCVLDLGCGSGIHREVCERAGFRYVGLDYGNPRAPLLGDAHALPFSDEAFEFVISVCVFEHLRYPFVAAREVFRVLKPEGIFLGNVAFLEPYHSRSYYHHSHLGTLNTLQSAGFKVTHVAPSTNWSVLKAQAKVLFPGLPRQVAKTLVGALRSLDRTWIRIALASGRLSWDRYGVYLRTTSGAFKFSATKPKQLKTP